MAAGLSAQMQTLRLFNATDTFRTSSREPAKGRMGCVLISNTRANRGPHTYRQSFSSGPAQVRPAGAGAIARRI